MARSRSRSRSRSRHYRRRSRDDHRYKRSPDRYHTDNRPRRRREYSVDSYEYHKGRHHGKHSHNHHRRERSRTPYDRFLSDRDHQHEHSKRDHYDDSPERRDASRSSPRFRDRAVPRRDSYRPYLGRSRSRSLPRYQIASRNQISSSNLPETSTMLQAPLHKISDAHGGHGRSLIDTYPANPFYVLDAPQPPVPGIHHAATNIVPSIEQSYTATSTGANTANWVENVRPANVAEIDPIMGLEDSRVVAMIKAGAALAVHSHSASVNPFTRKFRKNEVEIEEWTDNAEWTDSLVKAVDKDMQGRIKYDPSRVTLMSHLLEEMSNNFSRFNQQRLFRFRSYMQGDHFASDLNGIKEFGSKIQCETLTYFLHVVRKAVEMTRGGIHAWHAASDEQRLEFLMPYWREAPTSFAKLALPFAAGVIDFDAIHYGQGAKDALHRQLLEHKVKTLLSATWTYRVASAQKTGCTGIYKSHMQDNFVQRLIAQGVDKEGYDLPCHRAPLLKR